MNLVSFQKFTLVDYPGKIATTVFTAGCNFRCPFCYNPELVFSAQPVTNGNKIEKDFFKFLESRKGKLDGVCITGGEPTLQSDLIEFMGKVKDMGYFVKLDTNGMRPDAVRRAIEAGVVDYFAMDIKNSLERYSETVGINVDTERIKLSVELIKNSGVDYDFRTTVVPGIHTYDDFKSIATWIGGAKKYALQGYRDQNILDPKLRDKKGEVLDLEKIKEMIEGEFGEVVIRD
ncbi:MAG: anaerobic ribonucleoside-triphosphate reductase activating protein [Candidatus Moranbacteria bacterium]|nr:anaerobic ribonucleoside-triphosphate reductase activating protein [Candidatus Moranbacteria bacterium]